jgi:hypothetical protein
VFTASEDYFTSCCFQFSLHDPIVEAKSFHSISVNFQPLSDSAAITHRVFTSDGTHRKSAATAFLLTFDSSVRKVRTALFAFPAFAHLLIISAQLRLMVV